MPRLGIAGGSAPRASPDRTRTEMGSVIQLSRHRPPAPAPQASSAPRNQRNQGNQDDESRRSLIVLVVVFTATAIAMSVAVVLAGSNSWAEAAPLILFVVVFALTKVFLANALFYVMIRSDAHSEAAAAAASKARAAGLVIRRPRIPPGLKQLQVAGARPQKPGQPRKLRLAILPRRKPSSPPPRRKDR